VKLIFYSLLLTCLTQCNQPATPPSANVFKTTAITQAKSYDAIKNEIAVKRVDYKKVYFSSNTLQQKALLKEICAYWAGCLSNELFDQWNGTTWDFNGVANHPGDGSIACGYFVTTLLRDMGLVINRQKLATCASSEMMKKLAPNQKLLNLSYLDYHAFNERLKNTGTAVYIIGLDFHTGFIVNDGSETWFIHSNYINRRGVTKEPVATSAALRASKTRWMVSLTGDKDFLVNWLKK